MKAIWDDNAEPLDPNVASWQPTLFGPNAESLLKQRPLFEGGMDRTPRKQPDRFESADNHPMLPF